MTELFADWLNTLLTVWLATYNQVHNILRLANVLPNFPFTASKTIGDYYLQTSYKQVASRVAERLKT